MVWEGSVIMQVSAVFDMRLYMRQRSLSHNLKNAHKKVLGIITDDKMGQAVNFRTLQFAKYLFLWSF